MQYAPSAATVRKDVRSLMDFREHSALGHCQGCPVRLDGICSALDGTGLIRLRGISSRRTFRRGQHIHVAEEPQAFFGAIVSGAVKLIRILFDGRQQVVGLSLATDSVGRAFGRQSAYYAQAATDVELCCFAYPDFERMLGDVPSLKHRLLEQTLEDRDAALDWMVLLGRKSAQERVASFLLMLTERATSDGPARTAFDLPLRREEIADFLGLTYETVSRQFGLLKDRGLIGLSGRRHVTVLDIPALADAAG